MYDTPAYVLILKLLESEAILCALVCVAFYLPNALVCVAFFFHILRRMGKNKALAHHTSTYFHTRRVSI